MPKPQKRKPKTAVILTTLTQLLALVESPSWDDPSSHDSNLTAVHAHLAALTDLQGPTEQAVVPSRTEADLRALEQWFVATHDHPPVTIRITHPPDAANATLFTTRVVPTDAALITVPANGSLRDQLPTPLTPLLTRLPALSSDAPLRLALRLLLHAADPQSPFRYYIRALPHPRSALTLSPTIVASLRPSSAASAAARVLRAQLRAYVHVFRAVHAMRLPHLSTTLLTWRNFTWALAVVMSRQNALPEGPALVPLWDMADHDVQAGSAELVTKEGVTEEGVTNVQLTAWRDFQPDEPVHMCYGPRGNAELLLYSGFAVRDNPHDRVDVTLPLDDPVLAPVKAGVLRKLGVRIAADTPVVASSRDHEEILRVARVVVMDKAGLVAVMREGLPPRLQDDATEQQARLLARGAVHALLETYKLRMQKVVEDETVGILLDGEMDVLEHLIEKLDLVDESGGDVNQGDANEGDVENSGDGENDGTT